MKRLKITYNAPATLTFVLLCALATLAGVISGGKATDLLFMTYHSSPKDPLTYLRFFTHVLGHADWDHLLSNTAYLLLLGPMLEEKYGTSNIVKVIIATALVTALVNYFFFANVGLCGASGVVFAFVMLTSFSGFRDGEIPLTFILVAIFFLGQQVYDGIVLKDDISNMAHVLGGTVGAILGYLFNKY